ncbi:MAG: ribbon-helix-helix domain-containing protein [Proteobacteria bacterium]|nr:ribbon-helix-helix domain-containing protein [Pseudomonadota bacterium]
MTPNAGSLLKRSMRIAGHRTSLALELEFWTALEKIARARGASLPVLIATIDEARAKDAPDASLASAVRVFVLENRI